MTKVLQRTLDARVAPGRVVCRHPHNQRPNGCLQARSPTAGIVQESRLVDYVLRAEEAGAPEVDGRFLIPVTVDDLAANGLLEADPQVCWERSVETLMARKDEIAGLAVASDEQIEACILYTHDGEIVSLRTFIEDGGIRLQQLLSRLRAQGMRTFRLPKVHPAEISKECLEMLGFRPAGGHLLYAATLRQGSGSP